MRGCCQGGGGGGQGVHGCSRGGRVWLLWGGGVHGCSSGGHVWLLWGACMVAPWGGCVVALGGVVAPSGTCVGYDKIRRYDQ